MLKESLDLWVQQVRMDVLDLQDLQEPEVLQDQWDSRAPRASAAIQGKRENKGHPELQDRGAHQGRRVKLVHSVLPVHQVQQVTEENRDPQECLASRVCLVHLVQ